MVSTNALGFERASASGKVKVRKILVEEWQGTAELQSLGFMPLVIGILERFLAIGYVADFSEKGHKQKKELDETSQNMRIG